MYRVDDPATSDSDWVRLRSWTDGLFDVPEHLPCSFTYGDETIRGVPTAWSPVTNTRRIDAAISETVVLGHEPRTGLEIRVESIRYHGHPVVEWTVWLTNRSDQPTPLINDLLALDATFAGTSPNLRHCNGDFYSQTGYSWSTEPVRGGKSVDMAPQGGRPCDGAFPYFRLLFGDGGLSFAVGWPGQWKVRVLQPRDDTATVEAGQQHTHLRLLPGETIRTPTMTLLAWAGDEERAVNLWRRWYISHVMPRPNGQLLQPLLQVSGTAEGEEFTGATEANQLEYQQRFTDIGLDYDVWWIDAGWYPCKDETGQRRWPKTGTWRPEAERFPNGFAPIGRSAVEHGAKLLVWFEPERVRPGTWWFDEFHDWLLAPPHPTSAPESDQSWLLDVSNQACVSWLSDYMSTFIEESGIEIYRQDFNFAPLEYWRARDDPDRQGMTENLHVQGYLHYFDTLLERHPGLVIDSCASGGRRNDLETMRRAVPLHYTDYGYGIHPVKIDFQRTMFEWLPYFRETSQSWDGDDAKAAGISAQEQDSFGFHCALAPMLGVSLDIKRPDTYDTAAVRAMIDIWRRASTFVEQGDYYALSQAGRSGTDWVGRQFCNADASAGFIQAIRHTHAEEERFVAYPKRLQPGATYLLEEAETGQQREVSGHTLASDGLAFELPARRASIWFYQQIS